MECTCAAYGPATCPVCGPTYRGSPPRVIAGTWANTDPRRQFVEGAQWWEFTKTGATMWPSDRDKAEAEAERRFPNGVVPGATQL